MCRAEAYGNSVLSTRFCYEPKIALKNYSFFKIMDYFYN